MRSWKIALIALDGASPDLVERFARAGQLPHLARLMKEGSFGPLQSVIPPVTGAAWGSFLTGVVPGRHGVFEWLSRRPGSYRLGVVDSSALPYPTLFEWLSAHGVRVGAIGVPLTYPVRPIRGFILSDLLTPPGQNYAYPPRLREELEELFLEEDPYPVTPPPWLGRPRAGRWLRALKASLAARTRVAHYLATHHPWDFFMVHVMETDSVQHQMWHQLDGVTRPRYDVKLAGNPILEIYQMADDLVGRLLASLGEDTIVFVVSDHGFGPLYYTLHVNTWLLRQGFLQLKTNLPTRVKRWMFEAGIVPENLYPWEERLRLLGWARGEQAYRWLGRLSLSPHNIDWERTYAYSYGNVGQIYLNRRGREPQGIVTEAEAQGIVEELEQALRAWVNPWNGERVTQRVFRREELYSRRALERTPELIFLPAEGYSPLGLSEFLSNAVLSYPVAHSGWHRMEGLFVGRGGPLRPGVTKDLRLLDLYPTICALMGVPLPVDIDGQVAEELFYREHGRNRPAGTGGVDERTTNGRQEEATVVTPPHSAISTEEERIRERLKGLGYL
jgi:predicted AlkP superfamily phosphohydrolase/phosphomutase